MTQHQSHLMHGDFPEAEVSSAPPCGAAASPRRGPQNGNGGGDGNGDGAPEPPPLNPNLRVDDIEITQGAQYFNFNGQGTGLAADNAMPLVTGKTTIIRVYPDVAQRSTAFPMPSSITGGVSVYQVNWPPPPTVIPLTPINGPIAPAPASTIQRANAGDTLNFRLPAWQAAPGTKGTMIIAAGIWDPSHTGDPAFSSEGFSRSAPLFLPGKQLRIFGVRIIYTGPDSSGAPMRIEAPPEAQMIDTLSTSFTTKTYPVSGIHYTGSTITEFNGDLRSTGTSGCGTGWDDLLGMLRDMRAASHSSDVYVGFLPIGTPTTNVLGCGGNGAAAGIVSNPFTTAGQAAQATMAHELAHAYGRLHAPCAVTAPNLDASYPAYVTGPPGSIGEVGFDVATGATAGATLPPSTTFDFMSYCPPRWVSPYTYQNLLWLFLFAL